MKFNKHIAILLVLMMALSTAGYCVFATEEIQNDQAGENNSTAELQEEKSELTSEKAELQTVDVLAVTVATGAAAGEADISWNEYTWNQSGTKYASSYKVFKGTTAEGTAAYYVERSAESPYTYTVYEGSDASGSVVASGLTGTTIGFTIKGLEGWSKQSFTVQAFDNTTVKAQGSGEADILGTYPGDVSGVRLLAGYNSVVLRWNAQSDAASYNVYDSNGGLITNTTATQYVQFANKDVLYSFKLKAVNAAGKESPNFVDSNAAGRVRTYYNYVKFKTSRTLKCYCGGHKIKRTFPKGYIVKAEGFMQARYMFYDTDGHKFYVSRLSMSVVQCDYNPWVDYTAEEAELFVTQQGIFSPTGWLVWANFYSQQVYVLNWGANGWTVVTQFPCSSGKASTPSPSGIKKIGQKIKSRHGRPYWSCYSSLNAFHDFRGTKERLKAGTPSSNGCIRVDRANAGFIYNYVPTGSTVIAW